MAAICCLIFLPHLFALAHLVLNLALVFLARHWLPATVNAALTAGLGIGLLRWARKWRDLSFTPLQFVRLRRLVFLAALCKGALSLLVGISRRGSAHQALMFGVQAPDPFDLPGLFYSSDSIWYPTSATKIVTLLLLGAASCFLLGRASQIARSKRILGTLVSLDTKPPPAVVALLRRAASALAMPASAKLPDLILADLPHPTPVLVGIRRPCLLIAPQLLQTLSGDELEMAFRHELAHFLRRDHWWRWLFTWIEDVGRLNPLSVRLATFAVEEEEDLCDRLSVHTSRDALILANAIQKSVAFYQEHRTDTPPDAQRRRPSAASANPPLSPSVKISSSTAEGKVEGKAEGKAEESHQPYVRDGHSGMSSDSSAETTPLETSPKTSPPSATTPAVTPAEVPLSIQDEPTSSIQSGIRLPSAVVPALLGRYRIEWNWPDSRPQRLQRLLILSLELSSQSRVAQRQDGTLQRPPSTRWKIAGRRVATIVFGTLLFLVLYVKFYFALTLPFIHP